MYHYYIIAMCVLSYIIAMYDYASNHHNNRGKVTSTLGELRTITTHDDNLERQYKEG